MAARVALDDQSVSERAVVEIDGAYAPGARVTVTVRTRVGLPFLPEALAGAAHAVIPVQARTVVVIDRYRGV